MAHAGGRPTLYTPELGDRICNLVATNECGLDDLCDAYDWMPNESSVRLWRFKHPEFSMKYLQAKQFQAELYAESTHKLAKEKYLYRDSEGNDRVDPGHVAWQKMNVNLRQWHASKLAPKVYGDKQVIETVTNVEHDRLKEEAASLRAQLDLKTKKTIDA